MWSTYFPGLSLIRWRASASSALRSPNLVAPVRETQEIYGPIAHRLGMGKIRGELEDRAFKYCDPIGYKQLADAVEAKRKAGEHFLGKIEAVIRTKLKESGIEAEVHSRIKRLWSIHQKLERQRIGVDQVYDMFA